MSTAVLGDSVRQCLFRHSRARMPDARNNFRQREAASEPLQSPAQDFGDAFFVIARKRPILRGGMPSPNSDAGRLIIQRTARRFNNGARSRSNIARCSSIVLACITREGSTPWSRAMACAAVMKRPSNRCDRISSEHLDAPAAAPIQTIPVGGRFPVEMLHQPCIEQNNVGIPIASPNSSKNSC